MENMLVYLVEGMLLGLIIITIVFICAAKRSFELEKRITRFSISSITDKPSSFFDNIYRQYDNFLNKLSNTLSKSKLMVKYSKMYEKYTYKTYNNQMDIISSKFITSFVAVIITFISNVLRRQGIGSFQIILALIVGFFIPDLSIIINNKLRERRIENDLFKAVIIMSNAFKSGRSIMQAVKIVSEELDGPIGDEFKKVYIDLTYGLELDVVFERLSNRINMEETKYMASSLVILNKTGGNVVQVFNSIEKSFFERKKLNDELKSVTALSNFVFKILVAIPFIIFVLIYILNPTYFVPFVTAPIGKLILCLIMILYILYIVIVKRVIKIREWYYEE